MKTFMNRIAIFAASAVVLGSMAYAQGTLTAEIPFEFKVSGKAMPAGSYTVIDRAPISGTHVTAIRNRETFTSAMAVSGALDTQGKPNAAPSLLFACVKGTCELAAVKTVDGTRTYHPNLKLSAREKEALAMVEVRLHRAVGE